MQSCYLFGKNGTLRNKIIINKVGMNMVKLNENWFVEPVFDFEYKTYQLRAYLRDLQDRFQEWKFYPYLNELQKHLVQVDGFKAGKVVLDENLRRDLREIDIRRQKLIRDTLPDDHGVIGELDEIISYASMHFNSLYKETLTGLEKTAGQVQISPLGIITSTVSEGILLFRKIRSTRIYTYQIRLVRRPAQEESYRDVQTRFLDEISTGMFTNFNEIKWGIMKATQKVTGTNAFLIESNTELPQYETLLPIAKQYLIRKVA